MTLCLLCAAIHHGHWCTYADVLFGQYCQKGAIGKSPCSPSLCPWRSTCCWNQKESSTEPPQSRHWLLPSRIHMPLWGARDPGAILTQPCACVHLLASLQAGLAFTGFPCSCFLSLHWEITSAGCSFHWGGRAGKAPAPNTPRTHIALFSLAKQCCCFLQHLYHRLLDIIRLNLSNLWYFFTMIFFSCHFGSKRKGTVKK